MEAGKSVIYIVSDIDKALAFEWIVANINYKLIKISFILINSKESMMERFLVDLGIKTNRVSSRGKTDWPKAIYQVYKILKKSRPDVIHCHLLQANIIGLTAGKLAGVKKRIYTRHHSSFHHIYSPKGVWLDKYTNWLATNIVAISANVYDILVKWENADKNKVVVIPHGFLLTEFREVNTERIEKLRQRYGINNDRIVIGVISRYTHYKGIQYIIPAFKEFLIIYPDAILVLANSSGDYALAIQKLLKAIPTENYREIVFEPDGIALFRLFEIYVHVPIDGHSEAFGQTYVEALAAGIPSVFTLSGIANEFIKDQENAIVVDYKDSKAIYEAMLLLSGNDDLKKKLIRNGRREVFSRFGFESYIHDLETLYLE